MHQLIHEQTILSSILKNSTQLINKTILLHEIIETQFTIQQHIRLPKNFESKMTVELRVMESFTLLCKVRCGVMLNNRISLKTAVLVEYA